MIVDLTWGEVMLAHYVAGQRIASNIKLARQARHGADASRDSDGLHITSCRGELAVAKALDRFWSGALNDMGAADVGKTVQVRAVNGATRRLIIHPSPADDDAHPFVLADCGTAPRIVLRGWIWGRDGKRQEWWQDPQRSGRPAFFVPHDALLPFASLVEHLAGSS